MMKDQILKREVQKVMVSFNVKFAEFIRGYKTRTPIEPLTYLC